ncbi:glycosyltransferase [Bacillota bacterium Lsc_1132]
MKCTIVIVFYKQAIDESKTFRTLKQALLLNEREFEDLNLILYDNSPDNQEFEPSQYEGISISYVHDSRNLGIAAAYNYSFAVAEENGSRWLLLLDHDTELTSEYIEQFMNLDVNDPTIAAIVPKINCENQMISPVYSNTLRPLQAKKPKAGLQEQPVTAINSGALIRVDFLNAIGGFNDDFPLDYLDHWLFYEIYARGYKVWVLVATLEHELSVMDYSRVSLERYKSILESEIKFYQNYRRDLYKSYKFQLAKRFLKQILTVKDKKIAYYTLRRLFTM